MALNDVYLNETPLTRYGFAVIPDLDGWRDAAVGDRPAEDVPGLAGRVLVDTRPKVAPRQVTVPGLLRASSLATLLENHRLLKGLVGGGRVELRFADDPDKILACELVEARFPGISPRLLSTQARGTLRFQALDPYWYDRDPIAVAGPAAARVRCPLGTAPIAPLIQIVGSATNPTVTLRNAAGDSVLTITWTGTLASTDYLEIDCQARTATKYASGVASDAQGGISGTFPILSTEDGAYDLASWPTLETSAGGLVVNYKRGWL